MKIFGFILLCLAFAFTQTVSLASDGLTTKESCSYVFVENASAITNLVTNEEIQKDKICSNIFILDYSFKYSKKLDCETSKVEIKHFNNISIHHFINSRFNYYTTNFLLKSKFLIFTNLPIHLNKNKNYIQNKNIWYRLLL